MTELTQENLKTLLQQWWEQGPVSAASSENDLETERRRLQQAEAMMPGLPAAAVADIVLDMIPADPTADALHRGQALIGTWVRSEKQRWSQRRAEDQSLENTCTQWKDSLRQHYLQYPEDSSTRGLLLAILAWQGPDGLQLLAELMVTDPPTDPQSVSTVFAPLVHRDDLPAELLFPRLLDGLGELAMATAIVDLSNYLFRQRDVRPHPATARLNELANLLAQVTQRLLQIEENPAASGLSPEQLSQVINDSVGLVAALADALAQIGDPSVVGKIYPCLDVKHRRVQLEAATALATLGEAAGKEKLISLAAEPVVRRRVLAYCAALGCLEDVDAKFQTPAAQAESELALWLSHPANMGFAPFDVTLVDHKKQYWPGYDEPVDCFLLRYSYPFEQQVYQNLGLVGPITHSFSTSLAELPPDDAYAVFAGWHVEHPEIYAIEFGEAGPLQRGTIARLEQRLQSEQIEVQQAHLLGHCLGEWSLVVRGLRQQRQGWAVSDLHGCLWLPDDTGFAGFDPSLAWYLHLGRKLLQQFNSGT